MPTRTSRNTRALMMLPVVGLCYWALTAKPPAPKKQAAPPPFRLRVVRFERLPLTAQDVARGADTKVHIKVVAENMPPKQKYLDWNWVDESYVVATKGGASLRITDEWGDSTLLNQRLRRSREGGGSSGIPPSAVLEVLSLLRLQDVPVSFGALNLQWSLGYGSNPGYILTCPQIIRNAQLGRKAVAVSASLPLRAARQRVAPVQASTDPLFDIRKTVVAAGKRGAQATLHLYYRGDITRKPRQYSVWAQCSWLLLDDVGGSYMHYTQSGFATPTRGRRHFKLSETFDIAYARQKVARYKAKDKRNLRLRGFLSVNHAWPREFTIPLPNHPGTVTRNIPRTQVR